MTHLVHIFGASGTGAAMIAKAVCAESEREDEY